MKAKISDLYDLEHTIAAPLLERFEYPWEALAHIKDFILELGPTLPEGHGHSCRTRRVSRQREDGVRKGAGPPLGCSGTSPCLREIL